jgi:ABC-type sugar transport system substrate-binding protein
MLEARQRSPHRGAAGACDSGDVVCRIGLFLMNSGDYQELLRDECVDAARRHGFSVRVFWADNDSRKQVEQIQACLKEPEGQRPTVVMTNPINETALLSTAYAAARLGIGWVLIQRWSDYLLDLRQEYGRLPIFSVTADQHEVGRIQGRQYRTLLPHGGELVYIRGPLGTSSAARRFAGVQDVLQNSSIEVFTVNSDWTIEGGAQAMKEWTRIFERRQIPKFIVGAQNDAMAMGAKKTLEEVAHNWPNFSPTSIPCCGCDGTPKYGKRLVTEGELTFTVIMQPGTRRAVDEIASMLGGGPRPLAEVSLRPVPYPEPQRLAGPGA